MSTDYIYIQRKSQWFIKSCIVYIMFKCHIQYNKLPPATVYANSNNDNDNEHTIQIPKFGTFD